jgi:hypothetical protein
MTTRLTPERIAEIRSYTTDNNGNRWWAEFGMGDALVFVEELLDGVEALAAEAQTDRVMRKFWREQFAWFWRFFKLDESKGEPWLCNETRTQLLNMQDRAALADRYRDALEIDPTASHLARLTADLARAVELLRGDHDCDEDTCGVCRFLASQQEKAR